MFLLTNLFGVLKVLIAVLFLVVAILAPFALFRIRKEVIFMNEMLFQLLQMNREKAGETRIRGTKNDAMNRYFKMGNGGVRRWQV